MKLKKEIIWFLICIVIGASLVITGLILIIKSKEMRHVEPLLTIGCLLTTFGLCDLIVSTCIYKLRSF